MENPPRSFLSPSLISKELTDNENEEVEPRRNKKAAGSPTRMLPEIHNHSRKIQFNTVKYGKSPFKTNFKRNADSVLKGHNSNKFLTLGSKLPQKKIDIKK